MDQFKFVYQIKALVPEPQTVFDIGAGTGQFYRAVRKQFPDCTVFAFEPLPMPFGLLSRLALKDDHLIPYNVALGSRCGMSEFNMSSFQYSSSMLTMGELHKQAFPYSASTSKVNVKVVRLDSIFESDSISRPALMKVDVQGYEKEVLEGSADLLKRIDIIICELSFKELYLGQPLFDEMYDYLRAKGFLFRGQLAELRDPRTREVLQIDAVFVDSHYDHS